MFSFETLKKADLPLFRQWLQSDHIKRFWQEPEDETEFHYKFLKALPSRGVRAFLIRENQEALGYIQYYHAATMGGGWWEDEKPGTYGIDLLIGEPANVGKGKGALLINVFIDFLVSREKTVRSIIIDPDPANHRAIRAFEKAGFRRERELTTPNGPTVLMRKVLKQN